MLWKLINIIRIFLLANDFRLCCGNDVDKGSPKNTLELPSDIDGVLVLVVLHVLWSEFSNSLNFGIPQLEQYQLMAVASNCSYTAMHMPKQIYVKPNFTVSAPDRSHCFGPSNSFATDQGSH